MASINISRKSHSLWHLRMVDGVDGSVVELPLFVASSIKDFDLEQSAFVHEGHDYEVWVVTDAEIECELVTWCVNGRDALEVFIREADSSACGKEGRACVSYRLSRKDGERWYPFSMACGFASIEISFDYPNGHSRILGTRDLVCICDKEDQERVVSGILDEFVNGGQNTPMRWMFEGVEEDFGSAALTESENVFDDSQSMSAFLSLCEDVVRAYGRHLGYFRSHAYSRTAKESVVVGPSEVHRLGRNELMWLATMPNMLHRTDAETAVRMQGNYYIASKVRTERPCRTYDNLENRSVIAFLGRVESSLSNAITLAKTKIRNLRDIASRLKSFDVKEGAVLSLVVIESCLEREEPLVDRARSLLDEVKRISYSLRSALPRVADVAYKLPRRSKAFQEILPYMDVYSVMVKWDDFGEFRLIRDGLVLRTWRMDKLYEYYVLYKMLEALSACRFEPDYTLGRRPIRCIQYDVESKCFKNEDQVATLYELMRGSEKVKLYYQPVFYGEYQENNEVDLYRTTRGGRGFNYWTPDFYLIFKSGGETKRIIFDAKFRKMSAVRWAGKSNAESSMDSCLRKYKIDTLAEDGSRVDALWLLCGRVSRRQIKVRQNSPWAQSHKELVLPDGVAAVAPGANALLDVFGELGIDGHGQHPFPDGRPSYVGSAGEVVKDGSQGDLDSVDCSQDGIDDVAPLIAELIRLSVDSGALFDEKYARRMGVGHPLLRRRKPEGREANYYCEKSIDLGVGCCYLYKKWLPNNLNLLKRQIALLREKSV
ncbi:hypothetical protein DMP07_06590 [Slackia faecicanis]|uniref:DUF2357 domain-containing protein n=1 Tax=Slackia faecicanis TaxID=255723 RepID=A0A3N0AET9_9ACTN|nr:hypothetical protein [Slackia faecicanis]RNL19633.1 hypothetical protein DMP07_06590 [Slackia faecicanis]